MTKTVSGWQWEYQEMAHLRSKKREPSRSAGAASKTGNDMTPGEGLTAFLLSVYLLSCGVFTLWFMAYVWCGSYELFRPLFPHLDPDQLKPEHAGDVLTFVNTLGGAVLGALILCFRNMYKYAVVLNSFRIRFSGSYLIGPWAAALIGIAAYAMVRGGLLVIGADAGEAEGPSSYAFLSIGIITGFAWDRMLVRIDNTARQIFGSRKQAAAAAS
jgi:hypothetical protein